MANTENRSKAAEFLATYFLLEAGHQVSYPIVVTSYDLLVTDDRGRSRRVQVKRGYPKKGESGVHVNLVRPGNGKRYLMGDADVLMVVKCGFLPTVWAIPFKKVVGYSRLVVSGKQWNRYRIVSNGLYLG